MSECTEIGRRLWKAAFIAVLACGSILGLVCVCLPSRQPLTVRNEDSVELAIHIRTTDGSFDWRVTLAAGASASAWVQPDGEASYRTTVKQGADVLRVREVGYVMPRPPEMKTCIVVSRLRIAEEC